MDWDKWMQDNAFDGGLLQSTAWAEFQRGLGRKVECVQLRVTGDELRTLAVEHQLPFGQTYIYSPRGPVGLAGTWNMPACRQGREHGTFVRLINEVKQQFPNAIFWRVEPVTELRVTGYELRKVKSVQPSTTLIVDLSKTENELLSRMKQKTRYNIKLAQKHGVAVTANILISQYPNTQNDFFNLLEQTAKRDGFRIYTREHYRKLLSGRHFEPQREIPPSVDEISRQARDDVDEGSGLGIELFGAFYNDQLLAGAIVAFFGKWAYYLHGASSNEHRDMMAPYLLHWCIMREAKRRGCTKYDLWGAGEEWPGVSKFKTGFAPATALTHYPGTFDVVLKPWKYWAYRLAQKLR